MAQSSAFKRTSWAVPTLEALAIDAGRVERVRKRDLRSGDWVVVKTRNSVYVLCMVDEERFAVSGGWFDKRELSPCAVTVTGCTWGGSVILPDIVAAPGLCLEFGNRVKTTRIRQVQVLRPEPLPPIN